MKISKEEQIKALHDMKDEDINYSDIPEVEDFDHWKPNPFFTVKKIPFSARIDADVLQWLRSHENVNKFLNEICREKMMKEGRTA